VVLAHARAILSDETSVFAEEGDLRDPSTIVASQAVRAHLDRVAPGSGYPGPHRLRRPLAGLRRRGAQALT
jgi:hypothetical protein